MRWNLKVTIEGNINVDGQWWGISIERVIEDDLSSTEKVGQIRGMIKGLAQQNIGSRISADPQIPGAATTATQTPNGANGTNGSAFSWPPPFCDIHREAMKVSKVQKKPGFVQYFCPKEFGSDYCKKRSSVDEKSGIPKFWEVK